MLLAHTASSVTVTITGTPHPPSFVRLITCLHSLKRFCYWGNGGWAPERSPAQWPGKPCAFRRWGGQPKKPRGIPGCTRTGLASLRGSRRWAGQPKEPRWCRESPRRGLASPACPPSLGGTQEPFQNRIRPRSFLFICLHMETAVNLFFLVSSRATNSTPTNAQATIRPTGNRLAHGQPSAA